MRAAAKRWRRDIERELGKPEVEVSADTKPAEKKIARRREVVTDEEFAVWQERTEALFQAHWEPALNGHYRSAEICRKLLGQQARVYGLGAEVSPLPAPTSATPVGDESDEPEDELSKLRAARTRAT